ncbi:MAG: OsmC family protein [Planctomycetes bacterium]|nr:OsmC family protein [Planctomycetota bacterium]
MVESKVVYEGGLRCTLTHGPSGARIATDAPIDNHGRGEAFSPTDLVGAALGSCILTTMGIVAKRRSIAMEGASATVVKEMTSEGPRRIARLGVVIALPAALSGADREILRKAGEACPVHRSLHPDVRIDVTFE